MSATASPDAAQLRPGDLARVASVGVRTRRLRSALSALGIAIGVAAIVAVLGLSLLKRRAARRDQPARHQPAHRHHRPDPLRRHRRAAARRTRHDRPHRPGLRRRLHRLDERQRLPQPADPGRQHERAQRPGSNPEPAPAVGATVARGSYLNAATATEPVCVLGAQAAQLLGIDRVYPGVRVWLGGMWFYVTGILTSATLAPEIDNSVLVGFPAAETLPRPRRPPDHDLRAHRHQPDRKPSTTSSPRPPTPKTRTRSTSANPPPRSPRAPTPRARSTASSSASAPSRCSSAPSASPTS